MPAISNIRARVTLVIATLALGIFSNASPALAHHPMGGKVPQTFMEGFLSGLGHPVIGLDHMAFLLALGVAAGHLVLARHRAALIAIFLLASAVGVLASTTFRATPSWIEFAVAFSALGLGLIVFKVRKYDEAYLYVLGIFAGMAHGSAFGEAVIGSHYGAVGTYLIGLTLVQGIMVYAVARVVSRISAPNADRISKIIGGAAGAVGAVFFALSI